MKLTNNALRLAFMLSASTSLAFPGAGPGSQLDVNARDLTSSSQNLVYIMNLVAPNSQAAFDAATLVDAAQHFQEEVELGPQDLDVDFNSIEQSFNDLSTRFVNYQEFLSMEQVRTAWFRVEQSNISLRQTWSGGEAGGQGGGDHGGWHGGGDQGGGDHGGWHGGGDQGGGDHGGGGDRR